VITVGDDPLSLAKRFEMRLPLQIVAQFTLT
jgi:hypothetical protein